MSKVEDGKKIIVRITNKLEEKNQWLAFNVLEESCWKGK